MENTCSKCKFFGTYKTDDGRYKFCNNEKIYKLFHTTTVDYDFGCIWFGEQLSEEDELIKERVEKISKIKSIISKNN